MEPGQDGVISTDGEVAACAKLDEEAPITQYAPAGRTVGERTMQGEGVQQRQQLGPKFLFHGEHDSRKFATSSIANIDVDSPARPSHKCDMAKSLKDLVSERLQALNINAFEAARRGGFTRTFVNDIVTGRKKNVKGNQLASLAIALDTSPAFLLGENVDAGMPSAHAEVAANTSPLAKVIVAGTVEAGAFREVEMADDFTQEVLFEPRDELFPRARMLAFDVAGDSMNALTPRPIFPGDRVICVAYADIEDRLPLRDGMTVVVERSRDGGMMREWSIKQIELYEDRVEFHPRSLNAKHKPIIIKRDPHSDDGVTVTVIGLVRRISNSIPLS
jgi:hypothetical protein